MSEIGFSSSSSCCIDIEIEIVCWLMLVGNNNSEGEKQFAFWSTKQVLTRHNVSEVWSASAGNIKAASKRFSFSFAHHLFVRLGVLF